MPRTSATINEAEAHPTALVGAQLEALRAHSLASALLATLFAAVLAYYMLASHSAHIVTGWLTAKIVITAVRLLHLRLLAPTTSHTIAASARACYTLLAVDGLVWGLGGYWFVQAPGMQAAAVTASFCCVATVATFGLQSSLKATAAYTLPLMILPSAGLISSVSPLQTIAIPGAALIVVVMLRTAKESTERLSAQLHLAHRHEQTAKDLAASLQELQQTAQKQSMWLATVSHDLRSPAHSILAATTLLAQSKPTAAQQRTIALQASAANVIIRLLSDLLDSAKLQRGTLSIEPEPTVVRQWFDQIAADARLKAAPANVQFHSSCLLDSSLTVMLDGVRARQVVDNFVANALKFTPPCGLVELRCSKVADNLLIQVMDTGPGMHPDVQHELFTPFKQFSESGALRNQGAGLGLSIAKGIATAMQGAVGVDSAPGRGSTFWARLPLVPVSPDQASGSPTESPEAPLLDGYILLAEDDTVCQLITTAQLQALGYKVRAVQTGEEALAAAQSADPPAFICMDCDMPGMGGIAAGSAITNWANQSHSRRPPMLAMSGRFDDQQRINAMASGYARLLPKPFRPAELCEAITEALEAAKTTS